MGRKGGAASLRLLKKAAKERSADAILHVGDFAYDLHDEEGKVSSIFLYLLILFMEAPKGSVSCFRVP